MPVVWVVTPCRLVNDSEQSFSLRFVSTIYQSTRRKIQENANSNILNYVNSKDHILGVTVFYTVLIPLKIKLLLFCFNLCVS